MLQPLSIRVNGLVAESIVDGPGLRFVVFTQGCPHNCRGCHNPDTHDPTGGFLVTIEDIVRQVAENPLLSGVTFSGGEPFLQAGTLYEIAVAVRSMQKNIVTYTGYRLETLLDMARQDTRITNLLKETDILIDGPYIDTLRDLELPFRGSSNQRFLTRQDRKELERQTYLMTKR